MEKLALTYICLEKAMATHSSTLAWEIPWTEEHGRLQSMRSLRVGHDWASSLSLFTFMHWRRKWQPTCLENPRDGGAWWAAVYGVTQSRTRLKRLSSSSKRLTDNHYCIYYCGKESLRRNGVALIVNKRVWNTVLGCNLKNDRMISVHFQGKPFNITVIQVYALKNLKLNGSMETYKTF